VVEGPTWTTIAEAGLVAVEKPEDEAVVIAAEESVEVLLGEAEISADELEAAESLPP